jgi:PTH1 family peptidyl-tRNA hydrolase
MKLIVGLGNPGRDYAGTRHNAGFMVVERIAERHGLAGAKGRFHASVIETTFGGEKTLLMEPTTYMNRSGQAVGEAARYHKLEPEQIMVVVDDTALPLGAIRIRPKGGAGSHNGLADIQRALGSDAYPRLRLGVGAPEINGQPVAQRDYVLGRFTEEQRQTLIPALDRAAEAAETWAAQGIDAAMNRYNAQPSAEADDA